MLSILFVSLKNNPLFSLRFVVVRARCGEGAFMLVSVKQQQRVDNHKCVVVSHLPEGKRRRWAQDFRQGKALKTLLA